MNENEQKTVLVTGGNGFIGTMLCSLLVQSGHNVINIDRSKKKQEGVTLYPFDIDNSQVDGVIKLTKPDTIIHLAADHEVGRSVTEPEVFYKNNVMNTIGLLNSAITSEVKNFIFSSSSSVYGDVLGFPTTEDSPKAPMSPYGRTKAMVEDILQDYSHAHGLNFVALRYFNVYGPGEEHKDNMQSLVLRIYSSKIFGIFPVNPSRDFIYVGDVVDANLHALKCKSGVYDVGSGNSYKYEEICDELNVKYYYADESVVPKGYQSYTKANLSKFLPDWKPKHTLKTGLKNYLNYLEENTND